jgi:hypothetical protein
MQGSQIPMPPPPCRNSSGLPDPPRISRMRQSLIDIVAIEWSAISGGSRYGFASSLEGPGALLTPD